MDIKLRYRILICVISVCASVAGCAPNTDVSPEVNAAYHEHKHGPRPPASAYQHPGAGGAAPKAGGSAPGAPAPKPGSSAPSKG